MDEQVRLGLAAAHGVLAVVILLTLVLAPGLTIIALLVSGGLIAATTYLSSESGPGSGSGSG
jgi:uncharacterized membrane protein